MSDIKPHSLNTMTQPGEVGIATEQVAVNPVGWLRELGVDQNHQGVDHGAEISSGGRDHHNYMLVPRQIQIAVNDLCHLINDWAIRKGFGAGPLDGPMSLALMHSELSEALEYMRHGNPPDDKVPQYPGVSAELADCMIRIAHYCGHHQIPLGEVIAAKHAYNCGRPHKHGKEF